MRKHQVRFVIIILAGVFGFSLNASEIRLVAKAERAGHISLTWNSSPNESYELQISPTLYGPWQMVHLIASAGATTSTTIPVGNNEHFFRVIERSIAARLFLEEDTVLSGEITLPFGLESFQTEVQYASLEDISNGRTNILASLDPRQEPHSFTVDTVALPNGDHVFRLKLISTDGTETSDKVQVVTTEPVRAYILNKVSFVLADTEWMFYARLSLDEPGDTGAGGLYSVEIRTNGVIWKTFQGNVQDDEDTNAVVHLKDNDARPFEGYSKDTFGTAFEVSVIVDRFETELIHIHRHSAIVERAPKAYSVVGEKSHLLSGQGLRREQLTALLTMKHFGADHLNPRTGSLEYDPTAWLETERAAWSEVLSGLQTNTPSHIHVWVESGSPATLGDVDLSNFKTSVTKKAWFTMVNGVNYPFAFVDALVGLNERTLEDVFERGKYPLFGLYYIGVPFSSYVQDLDKGFEDFAREFLERVFKPNPYQGGDGPSYREAMEMALASHPELRGKIGIAGCVDCRANW